MVFQIAHDVSHTSLQSTLAGTLDPNDAEQLRTHPHASCMPSTSYTRPSIKAIISFDTLLSLSLFSYSTYLFFTNVIQSIAKRTTTLPTILSKCLQFQPSTAPNPPGRNVHPNPFHNPNSRLLPLPPLPPTRCRHTPKTIRGRYCRSRRHSTSGAQIADARRRNRATGI